MAALPYIGITQDLRIQASLVQGGGVVTVGRAFTKGATDRIPGQAGGNLWGASWPEFGLTNQRRQTADYYANAKELRGFVQDGSGAPIARTVVAISQIDHQVLGSTVSNATTGAFTLPLYCSNEAKVTVVAIPIDGDMRNVVAYRDIVPVVHV